MINSMSTNGGVTFSVFDHCCEGNLSLQHKWCPWPNFHKEVTITAVMLRKYYQALRAWTTGKVNKTIFLESWALIQILIYAWLLFSWIYMDWYIDLILFRCNMRCRCKSKRQLLGVCTQCQVVFWTMSTWVLLWSWNCPMYFH